MPANNVQRLFIVLIDNFLIEEGERAGVFFQFHQICVFLTHDEPHTGRWDLQTLNVGAVELREIRVCRAVEAKSSSDAQSCNFHLFNRARYVETTCCMFDVVAPMTKNHLGSGGRTEYFHVVNKNLRVGPNKTRHGV